MSQAKPRMTAQQKARAAGRQPSEAETECDVLEEFGRLAQPSLYPSLFVWRNEVGLFLPLSEAIAATAALFRRGSPAPSADDIAAALKRTIRRLGAVGSPDLFLAVEGRLAGVELKRPGDGPGERAGVLSADQVKWHAVAQRKGVPVGVITGPEQCEPFIRALLAAPPPPASPGRRAPIPTP